MSPNPIHTDVREVLRDFRSVDLGAIAPQTGSEPPEEGGSTAVYQEPKPPGLSFSIPHPQSANAFEGSALTLFVSVSGEPPFTFEWSFYPNPMAPAISLRANSRQYTIPSLEARHAGFYRCRVSNAQCPSGKFSPTILLRVLTLPND